MGIQRVMFALALALASGAACKKTTGAGPPTKVAPELVGFWTRGSDGISDFMDLDLRADGSYTTEDHVECVDEPCPSIKDAGKWLASDFSKGKTGQLKLTGAVERVYDATLTTSPKKTLRLVRKDGRTDYDATWEATPPPK